ncbi:hypothetical protein EO087_11700 [Dyella sp. M7H15-1]|uniref:hypothetical protein n=1 Tax=Dyella sp. M7H15-1 TaxID=2501295 RepID=UPI001004E407|nr:hypothetical protein [Dyella sp. M7H15-1]QAU24569.1 hypothetical protein EO087_11700 [Dyella sp. M7H15-1]
MSTLLADELLRQTRSGVERIYSAMHTCIQQQRSVFAFYCDTFHYDFGGTDVKPSLVPTPG